MTVTTEKKDNVCTLIVSGDVDTLTAPELSEAVSLACADCEKLVMDLAGVDYMSSAGIRAVVSARRTMGNGRFSLKNLTKNVQNVLQLTGFLDLLNVE